MAGGEAGDTPPDSAAGCFELASASGHLARRFQQAHLSLWTSLVPGQITSPQYAVLHVVAAHPDIDQTALAERAALDRSTTADVVARLESRGLLQRRRSDRDARRNTLRLTDRGHTILTRAAPRAQEVNQRLLATLEPGERRTLIELLQRLLDGTG